jgi:hypothetical protein
MIQAKAKAARATIEKWFVFSHPKENEKKEYEQSLSLSSQVRHHWSNVLGRWNAQSWKTWKFVESFIPKVNSNSHHDLEESLKNAFQTHDVRI